MSFLFMCFRGDRVTPCRQNSQFAEKIRSLQQRVFLTFGILKIPAEARSFIEQLERGIVVAEEFLRFGLIAETDL